MTYELDCAGTAVVIRVFFPDLEGQWRVTVQASRESDGPSSTGAAPSRVEAFRGIANACRAGAGAGTGLVALGRLDWDAIEAALVKVRAL